MASTQAGTGTSTDPVLFAYDGSELAAFAIEESARQLAAGREAVVLCVWQPADVGFTPTGERHFDADQAPAVQRAAEETAAYGAALAAKAGFRPQSLAVKAAPTWKGIVETAERCRASLIVLGSHRRSGLGGHLLGSVAAAVVAHSASSVLVVHQGRRLPAATLGAASGVLAATTPPATRRGRDPHRPAVPGSHVGLRHGAYLLRHMSLMRAAAGTKPVGQPRGQLHTGHARPRPDDYGRAVQRVCASPPTAPPRGEASLTPDWDGAFIGCPAAGP